MKLFSKKTRIVLGLGLWLAVPLAIWSHGGMSAWRAPAEAQKVKNPVKATPESIAAGKKIYSTICFTCHGQKGDGKGPAAAGLNPPPANFADTSMMKEMTDGELFWKITNGDGKQMASYKNAYRDTDRWNLVNYIRTFSKAEPAKPVEGKVVYTCPMHPEVISDQPGKCPKCGMTLIPKKLEPPPTKQP